MSDWTFLEHNRVRVASPYVLPHLVSDSSYGFNGMFRFMLDGRQMRCVASDGMGWQHVSVSIEYEAKPPSWTLMCKVKDLFWDAEDWVCQFHPAHSEYVNHHPGCLHLWRPTKEKLPTPLSLMVGPKPKARLLVRPCRREGIGADKEVNNLSMSMNDATKPFTAANIQNWHDYEEISQSGLYNMFDPRAREATGLTSDEYSFVMRNYSELKEAAQAERA